MEHDEGLKNLKIIWNKTNDPLVKTAGKDFSKESKVLKNSKAE